jgi:hypothetical protein
VCLLRPAIASVGAPARRHLSNSAAGARVRPRIPRYANITATLALFLALGGTATAAATLERGSVGAREIAKDAVRSPEIQDETIRLNDLSRGTRRKLEGAQGAVGPQGPAGPAGPAGTSEVRFAEDDAAVVPDCGEGAPFECPNVQSIVVTRGSWLVQAKFTASDAQGFHQCALVAGDTTTIDDTTSLDGNVLLTDALTVSGPTRVALRCTELLPLTLNDVKLTALAADEAIGF